MKEKELTLKEYEDTFKLGIEIGELSRKTLLNFINGGIDKKDIINIIVTNTIIAVNKLIGDEKSGDISFNEIENSNNSIGENIWEKTLEFGNLIGNVVRKGLIKILKGEINEDSLIKDITQTTHHAVTNILHIMGENPNQEIIKNIMNNFPRRRITINVPLRKGLENVFNPINLGKPPIYPGDPNYPE